MNTKDLSPVELSTFYAVWLPPVLQTVVENLERCGVYTDDSRGRVFFTELHDVSSEAYSRLESINRKLIETYGRDKVLENLPRYEVLPDEASVDKVVKNLPLHKPDELGV